jgi:hypothetical protein
LTGYVRRAGEMEGTERRVELTSSRTRRRQARRSTLKREGNCDVERRVIRCRPATSEPDLNSSWFARGWFGVARQGWARVATFLPTATTSSSPPHIHKNASSSPTSPGPKAVLSIPPSTSQLMLVFQRKRLCCPSKPVPSAQPRYHGCEAA